MLDLGHIKTYVGRYDAFDVTSKSIRSTSTLSEINSSQVVQICCSLSGWRGQVWWYKSWFTLKLIRPKSIRPNWGQFDHDRIVWILYLILNQWRYNKTIIDLGIRATYDMLDLKTKCCPRPSASGNILSSGPTYHMLPSSPVNNCIIWRGFPFRYPYLLYH